MSWEYKLLEPLDYGHPGGADPRFSEFLEQINEHAKEGWEVVQLTPGMMRGRIQPGGKYDQINMTTVGCIALLRRKVE